MKLLYTGNQGYADVFEGDDGTLYLVVLCGGIAWRTVGIVLNEQERIAFINDARSVDDVAQRMCRDFSPFEDRDIPEDMRPLFDAVERK